MTDTAGWTRLAGGRPQRTSSATVVLIWLAWLGLPPMLLLGGMTSVASFFAGLVLAVGLPFTGLLLTLRSRRVAAAVFAVALVGGVLVVVSYFPDGWYRDRDGGHWDPGPSWCMQQTWGEGPCPDG